MTTPTDHAVHIIGAGPAGLMAAETLARAGARVIVHDRMPSVGRKLLMAGRGGLNLTHSEAAGRPSSPATPRQQRRSPTGSTPSPLTT